MRENPPRTTPAAASYWERTTYLAPADLLVIGAGITGSSVALYYKRRFPERRVVVLEKGWIPAGATTRNAGFACFGSVSELLDDMTLDAPGTVIARVGRRIRGLRRLRSELGDEAIGYEACGGAEIFTDPEEHARCAERIPWINRAIEEHVGLAEAYRVGTRNGHPAIECAAEGAIHSGKMMRALHGKLLDAGVEIATGASAGSPVSEGPSWRVPIGEGTGRSLQAQRVVVAANGFAGRLLDVAVRPARGLILVSRPLTDLRWKGVFHYNKGYVYYRHLPDGRLLLGGARDVDPVGEETADHGSNPAIRAWLTEFAEQVLRVPLADLVEMEWSGTMGFTDLKEPLCLEAAPRLWCLAGMSGIGVSLGMQAAWDLVEAMEPAG